MTAPSELRVSKDRRTLTVSFPAGETYAFPAEYLRVMSPSAEVQGHMPEQRKTVPGKKNVEVLRILPIGNYAVRIEFDDLHNTGIFSWVWFAEMGAEMNMRWQGYLDELEEKGLSRDPVA